MGFIIPIFGTSKKMIKDILNRHIRKLRKINEKNLSKTVKKIDKLTQELLAELYNNKEKLNF